MTFEKIIKFVQEQYQTKDFIPLHAPVFMGSERKFLLEAIDSTFVSSVGKYVDRFEADIAAYTSSPSAVATVNGTAALHTSLILSGVAPGDLVITQPLTFVATCNAISYCGAEPIFIDVDLHTMGLSPAALEDWLSENAVVEGGICKEKKSKRNIKACVVMHTFGHPAEINKLSHICDKWNLCFIEDSAESLGSFYNGRHTGTFGKFGVLSFNGNKIITTGGGGMLLTDIASAVNAKHLTTTAKKPHPYEYIHDAVGYNYRLPNLNAALGCAQLELLEDFVSSKRALAYAYSELLRGSELAFFSEPKNCRSNYWLNAAICEDLSQRNAFLKETNAQGVMTRPIWALMNRLTIFSHCLKGSLTNAEWLESRVVNLPSSVTPV